MPTPSSSTAEGDARIPVRPGGFQAGAVTAGIACALACALLAPAGITSSRELAPEVDSTPH